MKYALIADIHGNLEALRAVLEAIDKDDRGATVLCAGDIVGYGPDPGPCIDLLRTRTVPCIRGNHEELVLGLRGFSRCVSAGITAARWTRRQLSLEQRRFLEALPILRQVSEELVLCHGDLASADTYISDPAAADTALEQLRGLARRARVLVCGHTHHAACYATGQGSFLVGAPSTRMLDPSQRYVINPGALGQSRDGAPLARFALLDLEHNRVTFRQLSYDHALTERKMRRAGLQGGVVLLPPTGAWRHVEMVRTRWERYWGDKENRRLGYAPARQP